MRSMTYACGTVIVLLYALFGFAGVVLEIALRKRITNDPPSLLEQSSDLEHTRRLLRWTRRWERSRIAVWLGLVILGAIVCSVLEP